jgi:hypothetical protein
MKKEIALQAVTDALKNINVSEDNGDNKGKWIKVYLEAVNLPEGYSWCAGWLKYRYISAANKLNEKLSDAFLKLDGWTPNWKKYAQENKIWIPSENAKINPDLIKPGYAIFFYSKDKGRIYHCGIVIKSNKDGVMTIEGNTSPGPGIEANGDGVYLKRRRWTMMITGSGFMKTY